MTLHLSRTVFIKNLNLATNEADLRYNFGKCGKIDKVEIVHDAAYRSKGFAYVSYARPQDAEWAVENLDGTMMDGRRIHVEFNRQKLRARREEKGFKIDILTKKLQEVEGYKNENYGDEDGFPPDDRSGRRSYNRGSSRRDHSPNSYSSQSSSSNSPRPRYRRRRRPYETWAQREETEFKIDILKKKVEEAQMKKKIYNLKGENPNFDSRENFNQQENVNQQPAQLPPQSTNSKDAYDSYSYSSSSYSSSSSSYYSTSSSYGSDYSSSYSSSSSSSSTSSSSSSSTSSSSSSSTSGSSSSSTSGSSSSYTSSSYSSSTSDSGSEYYYYSSYSSRSPSPSPKKKKKQVIK